MGRWKKVAFPNRGNQSTSLTMTSALGARGVAGDGGAALGALAELGRLPGLGGQAGALLHLGRSAFRSCHNSVSVKIFRGDMSGFDVHFSERPSKASQTLLPLGVAEFTPIWGSLSSLKSPNLSFISHSRSASSHFG